MPGGGEIGNLRREEGQAGLQHRHIDELTLAGMGALEQRRGHGEGGGHAGQHVADREAGAGRPHLGVAGQRHDARQRLDLAVIAGLVAIRAGLAEAGHRAIDQPRVDLGQRGIADAEPVHHAGAEILHDHVGVGDQALDDLDRRRLLQIQRQAALVAVDRQPGRRHAAVCPLARQRRAAHVLALAALHLDDVGAEQGELEAAERSGKDLGEIEDACAGKRAGGAGHSGPRCWGKTVPGREQALLRRHFVALSYPAGRGTLPEHCFRRLLVVSFIQGYAYHAYHADHATAVTARKGEPRRSQPRQWWCPGMEPVPHGNQKGRRYVGCYLGRWDKVSEDLWRLHAVQVGHAGRAQG